MTGQLVLDLVDRAHAADAQSADHPELACHQGSDGQGRDFLEHRGRPL
jgi:hypothetical protein